MTITTMETPTTAAELLAELQAATWAVGEAQAAKDHAATAAAYEREAAAWEKVRECGYGRGADPDVLTGLIAQAITGARWLATDSARAYRRWAANDRSAATAG